MTVKLWRIFNIFSTSGATYLIFVFVFAVINFSNGISQGGIFTTEQASYILTSSFSLALFLIIVFIINFPGKFEIGEGTFKYRRTVILRRNEGFSIGKRRISRSISFTVSNIRDIEFLQNPIERFFNVGRLRFGGDTKYEGNIPYSFELPDREYHTVCGIPHFSQFKKDIDKYL